jgi:hypothetical protein
MAGHGGARSGAGRPRGAKDKDARKKIERIRVAATAFLKTNDAEIFDGDSLELAKSIYKNEKLPLILRTHALGIAIPFERPRLNAIDARILLEKAGSQADVEDDPAGALINAIARRASMSGETYIAEITPPSPPLARHARRPPIVDGDELLIHSQGPDGEKVAETLAPDAAVPPVSAPCPEPPPEKPVDPDMIEVNTPTRSGWITRYVPRVK